MQVVMKIEEEPDMASVVNFIEKKVASKGCGCSSRPVLTIIKDCPDEEVTGALSTKDSDCAHIIGFQDGASQTPKKLFVVGNNVSIALRSCDIKEALWIVVAVHYILNIQYPKCYAGDVLSGGYRIFRMDVNGLQTVDSKKQKSTP